MRPAAVAMPLKSILVLVDFGAADATALRRAAQLAAAHRATLRLLHAPRGDAPPPADAARRLARAGRQLQESTGARVKTVPAPARTLAQVAAEARWSDLVVVADRRERSLAAFVLGQPVLRLARRCTCPLLVVRSSGEWPYERVVVRGDAAAAGVTARVAAELAPRAQVELVDATKDHQVAGDGLDAPQQSRDLVAIGTRRAPAWFAWLASCAPSAVWRDRVGDLLLVPGDCAPAGRSPAARRLLRDQERCRTGATALSRKRSS